MLNLEYMNNAAKDEDAVAAAPSTGLNLKYMNQAAAEDTAAHMAPQLDRPAVFAKIRASQDALIADAMTNSAKYRTPAYVPLITMLGASRPATPEDISKGLVDSPKKPAPLAPEAKFKQVVADIYLSDSPPEEKEALIKRASRAHAIRLFDAEKAPIQAYYDFRLTAARDAERHGVDLTDWIKNWKNAGGWGEPSNADIMQMLGDMPDTLGSRASEGFDAVARGAAMVKGGIGGMFGADEYARAAYLAQNAPELAPTLNPDWADNAINIVGETLPYVVATTAAALATGGLAGSAIFGAIGGGFISFGVEGNAAYQDAFAATGDEVMSRKIGLQVGLINAVVEAVPFGSGTKYVKGMWKTSLEKAVETKMMKAGKWTLKQLKTAVEEGLEESGQELSTMYGETKYREVKGKEIVERVLQAGAAGFLLGGAMSIALSPLSSEGADAEAKRVRDQMGNIRLAPLNTISQEENAAGEAALVLSMQQANVPGAARIKLIDEARTLADNLTARRSAGEIVTPKDVREIIVAHGLDPDKHTPETLAILGQRMNDGTIEIYRGGSIQTVFHELAHDYARIMDASGVSLGFGKVGENTIAKFREEYERDNPDTSGPQAGEQGRRSDAEWFADMAADNALRKRTFLVKNKSLRSMLDFQEGVYKNILARVYNLHKNVRAGRVSAQFQEMLEAPFKPASKYTFTETEMAGPPAELMKVVRERQPQRTAPGRPGPNPEEQRQRNAEKKLVRQHNEYFEKYRKLPTSDLEKKIRKIIENHAKLLGLTRDQERSFIPPEAKDQALVLSKELIEKAKLLKTPIYSLGVVPNPVGSSVTAPRTRYSGEIAANGAGKNVWVRPSDAERYAVENSKRVLLVQFSTDLLNAGDGIDTDSATLSRKLYNTKDGYHRPTSDGKVDFWEIPTWITEMAYTIPNSDVYVVRDMAEAKAFLQESGYKNVAFSALDVNAQFIKGLVQDFPGKVAVGGYVGEGVFTPQAKVGLEAPYVIAHLDELRSDYMEALGIAQRLDRDRAGLDKLRVKERKWIDAEMKEKAIQHTERRIRPDELRLAEIYKKVGMTRGGNTPTNIKWYDSIESFVKDQGLTYKHGADYRHFQGSETVARLCLSKGCLHRCAFCSVSKDLGKRSVEEITPAVIEQQIESFKDLYTPLVYLNDKTFGQSVSAPKLAEYGDRIKKNNPEFEGFVIQTTANQMRKFTPEYLAASHIKIVELGVESYNNEVLGPMRKPASEKTLQAATDQIRENGLELVPNIMVGLPGETAATYAKTLAFLEKNKDIISHVNIYNTAVYRGTELAEIMGEKVTGDMSENAIVKSWMKNPELHKKFSRDVHKFAGKQLERGQALFDLRPLEKKVAQRTTPVEMSSQTPIGILLSDGRVLPVGHKEIHADLAAAAGVGLSDLIKEGVVRYRASAQDVLVEAGKPMTAAQQDALTSVLDEHPGLPVYFDYTSTMEGEGFASWAYLLGEDVDTIMRDVEKRLGKPVAALLDLSPIEQEFSDRFDGGRKLHKGDEAGWILRSGKAVAFPQNEMTHATVAGSYAERNSLLAAGVIRFRRGTEESVFADAETGELIIEAHLPMTYDQRDAIRTYLEDNFGKLHNIIFEFAPHARRGGSSAYSGEEGAADIVDQMQKELEGAVSIMLDLAAVADPAGPSTKEQAVQGNILSEILGMKEGEHKTYIAALTNKTSMDQLTYGEAAKVINAYTSEARTRGIKLAGVNQFADWLGVLMDTVSKVKDSDINGLRPSDLVETWRSFKKGANGYFLGGARIERLVWALGGYERGSLYKALFLRVREASDRGDVAAIARMEDLQGWLYGTFSKEQMDALLSKQQDQVLPDKYLDPAEQISFLLMAKNEHGLRHLTKGHNYLTAEVIQAVDWITANRKDVVAVADWMAAKYEEQFARLDAEHFRTTGERLLKEDFYSPLYLKNVELERQKDFMSDLLDSVQAAGLENKPGELRDRSFNAEQPVRMDAFDNYGYNTRRVERYTAMAFAVNRAAKILNNRNFRAALNRATSGYGDTIMRNWLTDTARGYAAEGQSFIDATARFLRRKSMVYVLGGKIVSALRQTLTLTKTMAIDPAMIPIVIRNLVTIPIFTPAYRKMSAEIFAESDMMKARSWDRIEAQLAHSKTVRRGLRGKTTWDEKLLFLVKTMDRYTTLISYKSAKELAIGKGMVGKDAIRFADEAIRSTQSMGGAVDLPAFFRGGTLSKLLTTFENDSNQNFNYWKFDVFGQYSAGKIGMDTVAYRLLMSYILPALLMGAMGRGGAPDDVGDVAIDLATFPLSAFVLFGRWAYALGRGFDPGNTIMDVPFTEAGKALAAAKRGDAGTAAWQGLKAAGAFSGTIPQQAFLTAQGVSSLATDPTADLRELLWSKSQLRGGRAAPKKKAGGSSGYGKWDKL